jgi:A/G-specific adenine glycosylase
MRSIPRHSIPAIRRALLAWHRRNGLRAPWRESGDPYHVLVAAVMAQQTQMSRVLPKYDEFVAAFPTVDSLARASTARVLRVWAPLGYNIRALRLHRAAKRIVREGGFPRTAAELERIEGIGPFTASIIASFAFAEPAAAIDTNVERVVARLVFGKTEGLPPARDLRRATDALLSGRSPARWNQAMMDLGGTVCLARKLKCGVCPVARWCRARPKFERIFARPKARLARTKRPQPPFRNSTRYYRGRIVHALRALPPGASMTQRSLCASLPHRDGLDAARLSEIIRSLHRDGLVRVDGGRVRLP